jgi:hypothetical protein
VGKFYIGGKALSILEYELFVFTMDNIQDVNLTKNFVGIMWNSKFKPSHYNIC